MPGSVGYLDQYVLQGGTTGCTMTAPSGTLASQMGIIFVANKNSSVTPSNPANWNLLDSQAVGTGADGSGTGLVRLTAWWRIFTGVQGTTTLTLTGANALLAGGMVYTKPADDVWDTPLISFGSDTSSGTGFVATMAANLGMTVAEYMLSVGVFTLNTSLPGRSQTIPGITGTSVGINSAASANGNKMFLWTDHTPSTAGSQSGASSTGATAGAATTGGAMNIRIRLKPSRLAFGIPL